MCRKSDDDVLCYKNHLHIVQGLVDHTGFYECVVTLNDSDEVVLLLFHGNFLLI